MCSGAGGARLLPDRLFPGRLRGGARPEVCMCFIFDFSFLNGFQESRELSSSMEGLRLTFPLCQGPLQRVVSLGTTSQAN